MTMTVLRSTPFVSVIKRVTLGCLGISMLLVSGALWPMIYGAVRALGLLQGDVTFDAAIVSLLTAVVLAVYVGVVTFWWYDRKTSLAVTALLIPLYASYVFLIARAYIG